MNSAIAAGAAALIVILIALAVATPASAAQLTVNSSGIFTDTVTACTDQTLATTAPAHSAKSETLRIVEVPAECAHTDISVSIVSGGVEVATGTLTDAAGGLTDVPVGEYDTANADYVAVFFEGWWIDNDWTAPTPPSSPATCVPLDSSGNVTGGMCTVTSIDSTDTWGGAGHRVSNVYVSVSSSGASSRVQFDFSQAPFQGWIPKGVQKKNFKTAPGTTCSTLPILTLDTPTWAGTYILQLSEDGSRGDVCPGP